jgi:4-oxalocrotonate tautomerase family enzyme
MPLTIIELAEGRSTEELIKMRDLVMDAIVDSLKLPPPDRNIRVLEYKPGLFQMKKPYEILINITMFEGRTKETKKVLYQAIVNTLYENLNIDKLTIFIVINESPRENWGVRGGIPSDEIKLDFEVKI